MPKRKYDSTKTRVKPIFDALWKSGKHWLPDLLSLPTGGCAAANITNMDLTLIEGFWGPNEKSLDAPVSLLSWLIRNGRMLRKGDVSNERKDLIEANPVVIERALRLLRTEKSPRGWHILEGPTWPDVFLISRDALVVIEGKRTEGTITTKTKWLEGRHQMWRHIDAAWEIRGGRSVFGFMIVESMAHASNSTLPNVWSSSAATCLAPDTIRTSFPHRSQHETEEISRCYLGVTTWQHVCNRFQIAWDALPHELTYEPGNVSAGEEPI